MAENRFSKGVKAAKERTAELEAKKKKQEQEVAQNKIGEVRKVGEIAENVSIEGAK